MKPSVPESSVAAAPAEAQADFLREFSETRGYMLGRPARAVLTPAGDAVLFLRSPARAPDQELYELNLATGDTRLLLRPADLLAGAGEQISPEEQARRERQRIIDRGFTAFSLTPDGGAIVLALSGQLFSVDRRDGRARALTPAGAPTPLDPRISPQGERVAYVSGGNVHVANLAATEVQAPHAITTGADANHFFGLAEFVAQEEMGRFEGMWWSPDGTRLAYADVDQSDVEQFSIADPARPERAPQGFAYPRPGRPNARVGLCIATLAGPSLSPSSSPSPSPSPPVRVDWDRTRYPYLARVLWDSPHLPPAILVQTRDQREVALLTVDVATGATRPLVVETDSDWVNLERDLPRLTPDGSALLWASEEQGARTLQLRRPDGTFLRDLVPASAGFLSLVHVLPDGSAVFVLLGDALTSRLVTIDVASGACTVLIDHDGCDRTVTMARHGVCALETRTGPRLLPETRVVFRDGRVVVVPAVTPAPPFRVDLTLTRTGGPADMAATADMAGMAATADMAGMAATADVAATAGMAGMADMADMHAAIIRPQLFDARKRYPVILHVYGGPHSLMVRADERHYLLDQWMADQGAIVVAIDNRGTPRRGRAWERAIKGGFADVPLGDQIAGLHALAARFPELDLDRVGVFGWSYGGFLAALAVLRRPDIFKVAVAGAPVVDWLDYDTHYTERYLDLPEKAPAAYRAANLLTYAPDLQRPLLLIHGTADDNVYFFHSLKLADALVRAERPFEFLPLARVSHQLADPAVRQAVWRRVAEFLFRELRRLPG